MPENYQHLIVCPKCRKRRVYLREIDFEFWYFCQACSYEWKV
ncbi:hypothetical protein LCGC14_0305560 [marine sediment metagenome]|uniref:Uncharacterized protein n=1 Tax=marine sediment metagenome TaxID=412755 RepID=A0A0F9U607_9ZZZZ